jgi:hypothetical protein
LWTATPEGGALPTRAIGFFQAAVYCNWLHNDRVASLPALLEGAYDLRGWSETDMATQIAVTRDPNARYFIPTYDEWAVATFYDPNRFGTNSGGWWQSMYSQDRLPIAGAPGVGETSVGWLPNGDAGAFTALPVGAYSTQSPWGLFDTSGTYSEFLETPEPGEFTRMSAGAVGGESWPNSAVTDFAGAYWSGTTSGSFRIGSAVPTPSALLAAVITLICLPHRARRN